MKNVQFKDFKNQLDSVNEFQIIYLKEYELNAYNIKPRITNNSRFSYINKINQIIGGNKIWVMPLLEIKNILKNKW